MATARYVIRSNKKKDSEVSVYVRLRDTDMDMTVNTGVSVPFNQWDAKSGFVLLNHIKLDKSTKSRLEGKMKLLESLRSHLYSFVEKSTKITPKGVKKCIDDFIKLEKEPKTNIPDVMDEYLAFIIEQMRSGERMFRGRKYTLGTIKSWNSFAKTWRNFQNVRYKCLLDFNDITLSVYSEFVDYCHAVPYTADTTEKNITKLKALMLAAVHDKVSDNRIYEDRAFVKTQHKAQGKKPYLNEAELNAIFNVQLKGSLYQKVRDVFLIGCYSGQRVSDYNNITKDNIIELRNGVKAFRFQQQKTGHRVIVPFLSSNIEAILKRWNYELPHVHDVLINRHIKEICKLAGIIEPCTTETMIGGKLVIETKPKSDLTTCHTARRSCITNLYDKNVLDISEIRSISGHKTDKSFEAYICLSSEAIAERIAEKLNM